jgi:hypothetical protein
VRTAWASWALAGIAVIAIALTFKPVVENDGVGYFVYLHSVVVDHDLDFKDEYAAAAAAGVQVWPGLVGQPTPTGLVADYFPVGAALLSLPLYGAALALQPSGEPQFGPPFSQAFALASLLYGLLSLALTYRLGLAITGSAPAAGIGAAAAALATPFAYYLLYEPSYSHTFSAFAVAAFLLAWWTGRERRTISGWLGLGLLGGLMALVRWQDGPLVAIALLDLPRARWRVLLLAPGALVAFAPQLWVDLVVFGSWIPVRPAGQELAPLSGHYLEVLFSSNHGLFVWSPILLAAAAGIALLRERAFAAAAAYAFVLQTAINGAAPDWWGGYTFGMRRFLDLVPFAAVGLAALAVRLGPKLAVLGAAAFAAWNLLLVANLTYVIRIDRDPGYAGLVFGQWQALPFVPRLLVQGEVVRSLLVGPLVNHPLDPARALTLLALISACAAFAFWVAARRVPEPVAARHP